MVQIFNALRSILLSIILTIIVVACGLVDTTPVIWETIGRIETHGDLRQTKLAGPILQDSFRKVSFRDKQLQAIAEQIDEGYIHRNIWATTFGGKREAQYSGYSYFNFCRISDSTLCISLPTVFHRPTQVMVVNAKKPWLWAAAYIMDGGPRCTNDPYPLTRGRPKHRAGIDLSPALARSIGLPGNGSGLVNWYFIWRCE